MKRLLLVSLMVLVSLQISCTRDTDFTTEAAREPAMTNSDLQQQIQTKINSDAALNAARLSVRADADRNTATLSGTVESQALRTRAVELAKSAHAGLIVEDRIDVRPREMTRSEYTEEQARQERETARQRGETIGSALDDAWIHSKIVAKLIADTRVIERKINVDVNNNMVTLRGTVDTPEQKSAAEQIAKDTDGVKGVVNQLKVQRAS
jgi:osmotically-inducible protein OsmY